jgi:hypothetical protein
MTRGIRLDALEQLRELQVLYSDESDGSTLSTHCKWLVVIEDVASVFLELCSHFIVELFMTFVCIRIVKSKLCLLVSPKCMGEA